MLGLLGSPKRLVVFSLAVLGFVLVAAPTGAAPKRATASNVLVTNTVTRPVPMKLIGPSSVTVANTPSVNVGTPTVKLDPSENTVRVSGPIQVQQPTPFHAFELVPAPASAGGKSCVAFSLPAGTHARIDHVTVTTYSDTSAVVYLKYLIREGSGVSLGASLRVPTDTGSDPNSRGGTMTWGANVAGGGVSDVQDGEIHSLSACIQSSSGQSASGPMILDGVVE